MECSVGHLKEPTLPKCCTNKSARVKQVRGPRTDALSAKKPGLGFYKFPLDH